VTGGARSGLGVGITSGAGGVVSGFGAASLVLDTDASGRGGGCVAVRPQAKPDVASKTARARQGAMGSFYPRKV
jgi:hypothetical protein